MAATATEDTTILGSSTETTEEGSGTATSGVPSATPNETPQAGAPDGSGKDSPKPTDSEGKPAQAQTDKAKPASEPWKFTDLTVPEGIEIESEFGQELQSIAQKTNLPKEVAQDLVNLQSKVVQRMTEDAAAEYREMKTSWETETKQFLGPDADKKLAHAAKFIEKFGDPELREILNQTGVGSHRALVKCFIAAGQAISEDTFTEGKQKSSNEGKSAAEILYGTK